MEKDYITIYKTDGSFEQMEVVATFRLEDTLKNCIIYKSLSDNNYYAASYSDDSDITKLNTDFSDTEKEQINKIFDKLNLGGNLND